MSHKKELVKNTVIIAIGKISTQILSYILLPLYTAKMAVSEYGTFDLVITLSLFLCPVITMLMEESMFRFLIDAVGLKEKKKVISQTLFFSVIGCLIFIPLAIIVLNIATNYTASFNVAFIIFVLSNVIINLSNAFARGLSQIKLYSISNFILGITTIIFTIIVIFLKPNAEGLMYANSIANILTGGFIFYKLGIFKYIEKPDKEKTKDMLRYSIPLVPNSISWSIINMSDRIILTSMVNSEVNGIYAMANKFPNIIVVLYSYFYTAWKESAAKILKEDNKEKFYNNIYHDVKKFIFSVTLCLTAVMPFAFPIFINKAYDAAYIYIPLCTIAMYYSTLSSFYGGIFSAYKDTKIMGYTTFIAAAINLVVDLLLVKKFEIFAACFSTLLADLIVYYYRRYKLKDYLKLKELKLLGPITMFVLVCLAYYTKFIPGIPMALYWILNVITLILSILYSIAINKTILLSLIQKIKTFGKKGTIGKIGKRKVANDEN